MPGITDTQSLRYGYVDEPISHTTVKNLADDIAAQLDLADTARAAALKRPIVRVTRNAAFSMPVAPAVTAVIWDNESTDTHFMVDIPSQPTRVTASSVAGGGVYLVQARLQAIWGGWTRGDMILYKNGALYAQKTFFNPQDLSVLQFTTMVNLSTVGDFIDLRVYHEGGGSTSSFDIGMNVYKLST